MWGSDFIAWGNPPPVDTKVILNQENVIPDAIITTGQAAMNVPEDTIDTPELDVHEPKSIGKLRCPLISNLSRDSQVWKYIWLHHMTSWSGWGWRVFWLSRIQIRFGVRYCITWWY